MMQVLSSLSKTTVQALGTVSRLINTVDIVATMAEETAQNSLDEMRIENTSRLADIKAKLKEAS